LLEHASRLRTHTRRSNESTAGMVYLFVHGGTESRYVLVYLNYYFMCTNLKVYVDHAG